MSISPRTSPNLSCGLTNILETTEITIIPDELSEQQNSTTDRLREELLSRDYDREDFEYEKSPHTKLHRSTYIVLIVLFYASISIFSWVVICILVYHPIKLQHYDVWVGEDGMGSGRRYDGSWKFIAPDLYRNSETWFRTARVLQSMMSILTIPIASAVCGSAAVVYAQRGRHFKDLSLGQLVLLADKSWSDPLTIMDLLFGKLLRKIGGSEPRQKHSKHSYASTLLILAILLHGLGSTIAPLQQILLSTKTSRVPTGIQRVIRVNDLPNQLKIFFDGSTPYISPDSNDIVLRTRAAMETAINTQAQAQMWPGSKFNCTPNPAESLDSDVNFFCVRGAILGNMSKLHEPFLAELPSYFDTGLIRQFIPRINSTAIYELISEAEFPRDCERIFGAFYVDYQNTTFEFERNTTWGLQACMPNNNTQSPWTFNRNRQDFTERLYLNITLDGFGYNDSRFLVPITSYIKITLNTTAGYFELPNYMNHGLAGALLDKDPFLGGSCGHDCVNGTTNFSTKIYLRDTFTSTDIAQNNTYDPIGLEIIQNKGPLLTTAMALFGRGSFPQTRLANPKAYATLPYTFPTNTSQMVIDANQACGYLLPLGVLLLDIEANGYPDRGSKEGNPCIFNSEGNNGAGVHDEVAQWLVRLTNRTEPARISNAFTAAAFLANQNWLLNQRTTKGADHLMVYFDEGMDIQVPVISTASIIVVSGLLGLYQVVLFALAVYAAWTPRWTRTLDSFAMMRVGATYAQHFPLKVASGIRDVEGVHRLSGVVGTADELVGGVQRLELGARGKVGPDNYLRFRSW